MSGVCSAGLASTALPAASAAAICPVKIASGKFHGEMQANTPRPCRVSALRSPVGPCSRRGPANWRRACAAVVAQKSTASRTSAMGVGRASCRLRAPSAPSEPARSASNRSAARSSIAARASPPSRSQPSRPRLPRRAPDRSASGDAVRHSPTTTRRSCGEVIDGSPRRPPQPLCRRRWDWPPPASPAPRRWSEAAPRARRHPTAPARDCSCARA